MIHCPIFMQQFKHFSSDILFQEKIITRLQQNWTLFGFVPVLFFLKYVSTKQKVIAEYMYTYVP